MSSNPGKISRPDKLSREPIWPPRFSLFLHTPVVGVLEHSEPEGAGQGLPQFFRQPVGLPGGGYGYHFSGRTSSACYQAPKDSPCPVLDTHIALTTFQLVAEASGVGTVWDGMVVMALAVCPDLVARLGIPAEHQIGYAMVFGEPEMTCQRTVQRDLARVNVVI